MAISGHNMTMKQVGIAELKSRLSEYLRAVRRGEPVSVLDRDTPVAQIVPVRERAALHIRKPAPRGVEVHSAQNLLHHLPAHICEPEIASLVLESQFRVIYAQAVENCGLQIVNVYRIACDVVAVIIAFAMCNTRFDAS